VELFGQTGTMSVEVALAVIALLFTLLLVVYAVSLLAI